MKKNSVMVICVFVFSGCTILPIQQPDSELLMVNCIPPLVDSIYPAKLPQGKQEIVLPGTPWDFVSDIPEQGIKGKITFKYHKVFIPQESQDIWVFTDFSGETYSESWLELWVYSPSNESWENRSLAIDIFAPNLHYLRFVHSKNGKIYAIQETTHSGQSVLPNLIAVYDENTSVFQAIQFTPTMPDGDIIFDYDQDLFWVVSKDGVLYRIDPNEQMVQEYFQLETGSIVYDVNRNVDQGSIYGIISQNGNVPENVHYDNLIYKFTVEEKKEEIIHNPIKNDDRFNSIFIDTNGNMWLNDHSMMSPAGAWYQIIRSSIFISDRIREMNDQYIWDYPEIVLESSNGYLWFDSANGISWFDPSEGEWCWVTNDHSASPVEGDFNDIWMAIEGKLYVYQIK